MSSFGILFSCVVQIDWCSPISKNFECTRRDADTRARGALPMALGTSLTSSTVLEISPPFPPGLAGCLDCHRACPGEHRITTVQLPQV